jgi:hypothetical protein
MLVAHRHEQKVMNYGKWSVGGSSLAGRTKEI